jgi:ABC transporter DrrB family efflux protein
MTAAPISTRTAAPAASRGGIGKAISDGLIVAGRNLKRVPRIPELAIMAVIQSIMFVLLFAFVFGGAIPLPDGGSYREFLMPGIFAQNVVFACVITAIGITDDVNKGIMDRFRSLPMARSAVLSGRVIFDLVYQGAILVVLMLSGLAVDWRVHTSVPEFLGGVGLLLLFVFAMSWIGVCLGLVVRTVESANQVGFTVIFPLTFLSNVFVPPSSLPGWLQPVAEWNPVSALTAATRELWGNPNPYASGGFPAEHPVWLTLIWVVIITAVFAPIGVRKYRSMSR